ncbi:MAG TPA: PilZ domain-containing protein [Allosphingosinicella sp.]|nr:PilZ domain-containing protein [Allosphingosinicella sp.]
MTFVQRQHDRSAVALPATVTLGGKDYSARILNLAHGGALIECSAPFPPEASLFLRCGSIAVDSRIVWEKGGQYGVNFQCPLSEEQVKEQLSRNNAIVSLQSLNEGSGPETGEIDANPVEQRGDTAAEATSAEHLAALEASHRQVEDCTVRLEAIMASDLSDLGQFSAARLQLRRANLDRTQIALDLCRHLMATTSSRHSLQDLQRQELDVSQMISQHVHSWTMPRIEEDWSGYCSATRKILDAVRALIASEKQVLAPLLQAAER